MKKAYYIITILLSGFGTALFVMAAIASREEGVTALAGLIISAVAAAFLVLSVLGLKKDSAIKGIVLEKVGVLLIGFAVLLLIAGFANLDKIIGAFAFAIPSSVGGVLCFRKGMRVVEKASEEMRIRNVEWNVKSADSVK